MKRLSVAILLLSILISNGAALRKKEPLYRNPDAPIEKRVEDLLSRMTLKEKVYQTWQSYVGLNSNPNNAGVILDTIPLEIGSLIYLEPGPELRNSIQEKVMKESRLGIPVLFAYDAIHGYRTIYQIPLGQACSWNTDLAEKVSRVSAMESRMSGVDLVFSPMIDVARDGRWGRISEGYGECPYVNSRFCIAAVRGYQGESLADHSSVAACMKHYVGYGMSEAGRDYTSSDISDQSLWETYLPPYEAGVKAGAAAVMSGFNTLNGIPASADKGTIEGILKSRWGFNGFVVSDWCSVKQIVNQGVAETEKEAVRLAINGGVDMDMGDNLNMEHLEELIKEGSVSEKRLDEAVRRILRVKFKLGLFENPYIDVTAPEKRYLLPAHVAAAEQMADESMVLLKNEGGLLPFDRSRIRRLALVGPLCKDNVNLLGNWSAFGTASDVTTIYKAVADEFGEDVEIIYARGCGLDGNDESGFQEAFEAAMKADAVICCLGEDRMWSGENASRSTIALPEIQSRFLAKMASSGRPVILIISNGRPLDLSCMADNADAIIEMWQPGIAGGKPVAGILSGRVNPSGRLSVTFPYCTGQIPIYYCRRNSARRGSQGLYQDMTSEPMYRFGHGLSFSVFEYGDIRISDNVITADMKIKAEVTVTNVSDTDGKEAVLWYVTDPFCSIARPVRELRFFEKKMIRAGESETFVFEIDPLMDLGYVDRNGNRFIETGDYHISAGGRTITVKVVERL